MKIAIVLPAFNESKHIFSLIEKIPSTLKGHTISAIVVDDGSTDATSKVAKSANKAIVLKHKINLGKGAAAKTGCDAAYKLGYDLIILMDADGQHRVEDLERIIQLFSDADCNNQLALGVRERNNNMPAMMRVGNSVMNILAKGMFNIRVSDTQSGFRAFHANIYPKIRWISNGYAMEMEMLILAAQHKITVKEVIIETIYHDKHKGTTVLDGVRILNTLIKWKILCPRESKLLE